MLATELHSTSTARAKWETDSRIRLPPGTGLPGSSPGVEHHFGELSIRVTVLRHNLRRFAHCDTFIEGLVKAGVPE